MSCSYQFIKSIPAVTLCSTLCLNYTVCEVLFSVYHLILYCISFCDTNMPYFKKSVLCHLGFSSRSYILSWWFHVHVLHTCKEHQLIHIVKSWILVYYLACHLLFLQFWSQLPPSSRNDKAISMKSLSALSINVRKVVSVYVLQWSILVCIAHISFKSCVNLLQCTSVIISNSIFSLCSVLFCRLVKMW